MEYRKIFQKVRFLLKDHETVLFILPEKDAFFLPRLVKFWIMAPKCLSKYSDSDYFVW